MTTGQQIKKTANTPKQVFSSQDAHLSDHPSSPRGHIPKQSIQVASTVRNPVSNTSSGGKTQNVMKVNLATQNTNKPLTSESSQTVPRKQPMNTSVSNSSEKPQPMAEGVKTGSEIDTPDERKSPKIKSGAISAMSKFWEKVNTGVKEEAPEILEDS